MRQRRIKRISGEDWKRLIKAHATNSLMNSLTPSAEVNGCFPNPLLVLSACGYRICLSVSRIPQTSLSQNPIWQPMARGPSDIYSNMATRIMLSPRRRGGPHVTLWPHAQSCKKFCRRFLCRFSPLTFSITAKTKPY